METPQADKRNHKFNNKLGCHDNCCTVTGSEAKSNHADNIVASWISHSTQAPTLLYNERHGDQEASKPKLAPTSNAISNTCRPGYCPPNLQSGQNTSHAGSHSPSLAIPERPLRALLPKRMENMNFDFCQPPHMDLGGGHDERNSGRNMATCSGMSSFQIPTYNEPYQNDLAGIPIYDGSDQYRNSLNKWLRARAYRRKVYHPPPHNPRTDATIYDVECNAEFWVQQLIAAMCNGENVKDTPGSHAVKLFEPGSTDPQLIDATCREIFIILIDHCKHGFRGMDSFNKALKPSRELESDKTARCQERLQNIIQVLMFNKRVCKDVLYEDWKIHLLVNHPLTYDHEKDSQKGSNDQRKARQLQERERLRRTEQELQAYQNGSMPRTGAGQL